MVSDLNFQMLNGIFPGKLEKGAVLKAICSGFEETTEPAVCLSTGKFLPFFWLHRKCTVDLFWCRPDSFQLVYLFGTDVETNECLSNNGGCWQDTAANITACKVIYL